MRRQGGRGNPKRRSRKKKALYIQQKYRCYYCREFMFLGTELEAGLLVSRIATMDHLVPHAKGGAFVDGNLVLACYECNQTRGTMDWRDFKISRDPWKSMNT